MSVVVVLVAVFVLAAVGTPDSPFFTGNVTSDYDEGNFTVNWTLLSGDADNYTIYIYANETLYNSSMNDSALGYTFSNSSEANYTFFVQAMNSTGDTGNSTNISIYVDATGPAVGLTGYTNATAKKNTDMLTLNISAVDEHSGLNGSACLIDVNGTNQTIDISDGWCNSSSVNLTGLNDSNHTINIYVNDTVGSIGLNSSYVVQVDTTAPVASALCTPISVTSGAVVTCTCSGTDATSGINSTTAAIPITTSTTGTITGPTCSVTDYAGNSHNTTTTYTVSSASSGGSASGLTYRPSSENLENGYTIFLRESSKISFKVSGESHLLTLDDVGTSSAKITVSSNPVTFDLSVNETKKLDLDDDNVYDVSVFLKEISGSRANIVLTSISESFVPVDDGDSVDGDSAVGIGDAEIVDDANGSVWGWVVGGIILVLIIVVVVVVVVSKKKKF